MVVSSGSGRAFMFERFGERKDFKQFSNASDLGCLKLSGGEEGWSVCIRPESHLRPAQIVLLAVSGRVLHPVISLLSLSDFFLNLKNI